MSIDIVSSISIGILLFIITGLLGTIAGIMWGGKTQVAVLGESVKHIASDVQNVLKKIEILSNHETLLGVFGEKIKEMQGGLEIAFEKIKVLENNARLTIRK